MKTAYLFIGLLSGTFSSAQDITSKLTIAVRKLESDAQFRHAILSLYVVDSKTGRRDWRLQVARKL